jgi:hypothetical protein
MFDFSSIASSFLPASYPLGTGPVWPMCEADHSPPASAEVKNGDARLRHYDVVIKYLRTATTLPSYVLSEKV